MTSKSGGRIPNRYKKVPGFQAPESTLNTPKPSQILSQTFFPQVRTRAASFVLGPQHSNRILTMLARRLLHTAVKRCSLPKKMPSKKELFENTTYRWLYNESERECSVLPYNALLIPICRVGPDARSVQCRGTGLCGVHLFRIIRVQFHGKDRRR